MRGVYIPVLYGVIYVRLSICDHDNKTNPDVCVHDEKIPVHPKYVRLKLEQISSSREMFEVHCSWTNTRMIRM